jgi:glyoxylase-like metal-dependent hydrolase (beta-lactamase superfamily II)
MSQKIICCGCGTQFPAGGDVNELCPVCIDDRQYIPENGQEWTSHEALIKTHACSIGEIHEGLYEIRIEPSFAIGQRAILVLTDSGNILWDCIPLLDQTAMDFIKSKGGLKAIAISHPHYYSNMNLWATVFNCPVYIHENDHEWVPDNESVLLWEGKEQVLWDDIKIINTGGHFSGSCVLHIATNPDKPIVLSGDSLQIARNKNFISIMHSYPNHIPLPLAEIQRIRDLMEPVEFEIMLGAFPFQNIYENAKDIFTRSMERYV